MIPLFKKLYADQRGMGLALIIILTAYIFIIGSSALALSISSRRNAGLEICRQKAYYTAEAGIEQAFSLISFGRIDLSALDSAETVNFVPYYIAADYADGQIGYVKASRAGDSEEQLTITMESLGIFQQARCVLKVEAEISPSAKPPSLYTIRVLSWKVNE